MKPSVGRPRLGLETNALKVLLHGHFPNGADWSLQMKTENRSVLANADNGSGLVAATGAVSEVTHEEISALAHQFYQQEGCPDGLAEEHWFAAEDRLLG